MRHIKVKSVEDVREETFKAYVRQAVASVEKARRMNRPELRPLVEET